MSRLTRDGTTEPISRDQILRHARGQGKINFPCSADHEQNWQPYPVDPYSAIYDDHTYIPTYNTYIHTLNAIQGHQTKTKQKHFEYIELHVFDPIYSGASLCLSVSLTYHPGFGKKKKCTV